MKCNWIIIVHSYFGLFTFISFQSALNHIECHAQYSNRIIKRTKLCRHFEYGLLFYEMAIKFLGPYVMRQQSGFCLTIIFSFTCDCLFSIIWRFVKIWKRKTGKLWFDGMRWNSDFDKRLFQCFFTSHIWKEIFREQHHSGKRFVWAFDTSACRVGYGHLIAVHIVCAHRIAVFCRHILSINVSRRINFIFFSNVRIIFMFSKNPVCGWTWSLGKSAFRWKSNKFSWTFHFNRFGSSISWRFRSISINNFGDNCIKKTVNILMLISL